MTIGEFKTWLTEHNITDDMNIRYIDFYSYPTDVYIEPDIKEVCIE